MTTWLVTGGSGFLGLHVLDALRARGDDSRVVALGRNLPSGWPRSDFVRADLDDACAVARAVAGVAPDFAIHAAGKTPPAPPSVLYRANTRATANLLNGLIHAGRPCRVALAGSAAELGPVPVEALPVAEDHPCHPADAYGLSKWAAARLGLAAPAPLEVVAARIFNPIGPGLPPSQAFGRFASLLAAAPPGVVTLAVGDLEARRDFVDVRDAARALIALAESGRAGATYHVGTGISRAVGEGLAALVQISGRSVRVEPGAFPGRGPGDSRADIRRILRETGWAPRVTWERSLADLWADAVRRQEGRRVA